MIPPDDNPLADAIAGGSGEERSPELPLSDDRQLADLPRNDYGNGQRFAARHGLDCCHTAEAGWHVWDGMRYQRSIGQRSSPGAAVVKRAHDTVLAIKQEAATLEAEIPPEPNRDDKSMKAETQRQWRAAAIERAAKHHGWAIASGNAGKIAGLLSSAEPYLRVPTDAFDTHPLLFNVQNGTIDLANLADFTPREPSRLDMLTHLSPVTFDAEAAAPEFHAFIRRILPDDAVRAFVQRWLGYCLSGLTDQQKLVINYGAGANGKSVLYNIVAHALGSYAQTVPIQTFLHNDRRGSGDATPDLMMLPGARLVMAAEPEIGARLGESLVKIATGGDKITGRHLFEGMISFHPRFKLVISANVKPSVRGQDEGIWRRVLLVPFDVMIPPAERDPKLAERLISCEVAGIFNWLLDGWRSYRELGGLAVPEAVVEATAAYRAGSDSVYEFVQSCTIAAPGESIQSSKFYEAYQRWCRGGSLEPATVTRFGLRLNDLKVPKDRVGGVMFYRGRLLVEDTIPQEGLGRVGGSDGPAGPDPPPTDPY